MKKSKYTLLLSNTIIFAFGNILVKLIAFFLMPLYTSVLTTEQYGVAELLNSAVEIVLPIGTFCIVDALYRFSIEDDVDHKTAFANAVSTIFIGDIFVLLGCIIWRNIFWYPYTSSFFLLYFSSTLYKLTTQFARGLGHVKRYALYGVINSLILISSNIILLVAFNGGVEAYLISFSIGYGVSGVLAFFLSGEYKYFSIKGDKELNKQMLRYSVPNIPNMLSWWINNVSDRYIIMLFWGTGLAGLFTAASKLPAIINLVANIFQQAWQYSTVKEIGQESSKQFFNRVFKLYSFGCLVVCSFLIFFNRIICYLLLQADFYSAWKFVPLLLMASTLGCFSTFLGTFYNTIKNNTMLMFSTVMGAIVNIILNFTLIPRFGGIGAAIGTVIGYIVITVIRAIDVTKRVELHIDYFRLIIQFFALSIIVFSSSIEPSVVTYVLGIVGLFVIIIADIESIVYCLKMLKNIILIHLIRGGRS